MNNRTPAEWAFGLVLILGIVNLFADMTYEGGRAITGPFLGSLGASAAVVGFVAGFGELIGYALRSVSGYLADRTQKYWVVIFTGYAVNMLAVPALALAGAWPLAAGLIIAERTGRAIRRPAVEAMLSHAGKSLGQGWVFGLNEALDQTGASVGPLITALVLFLHRGYHQAFAALLVSALLCLGTLVVARLWYARPQGMEEGAAPSPQAERFPVAYWSYVAAGALVAAGFADFSLIAFHFQKVATVTEPFIPVLYSAAMATGALASLVFGRLLDRFGRPTVIVAFFASAWFAPLVFFGGPALAWLGVGLWGLGMGAQDSILKALLAGVVPPQKRSTAFGVFDTGFGFAWFAGSAAMGLLYHASLTGLVVFSVALQLAALPVFAFAGRRRES